MSDFPLERLANNEAIFSYTGVDYFGSLIVKHSEQCKPYEIFFKYLTRVTKYSYFKSSTFGTWLKFNY